MLELGALEVHDPCMDADDGLEWRCELVCDECCGGDRIHCLQLR
jgi:hypothetical protein